jgi:threonylcarbamoyladenosine tRNA methylthiotransferase MtaB
MDFAGAHLFTYSVRPGTPAAGFPDPVAPAVQRERYLELQHITRRSAARFTASLSGQVLPVLWEKPDAGGQVPGLTDNYARVLAPPGSVERNTITLASLRLHPDGHLESAPVRAALSFSA